jgi:DNA-binding response OmpR family regulator
MMSGLDGFEVVHSLAADQRTAAIPVGFVGARAGRVNVLRGLEVGAVGYFSKSVDAVRLGAEVDELLERVARDRSRAGAGGRAGAPGCRSIELAPT